MFQNSLALVEECGLTFLHVFPFSAPRHARGEDAASAGRRAVASVLAVCARRARRRFQRYFAQQVGQNVRVLIERAAGASASVIASISRRSRSPPAADAGSVVNARIAAFTNQHLLAEAA